MSNKMLIDASHPEETRVAVVRGNRIEEFDFESQEKKQLRGNIYLAKVTRVEPSLQAAFIDYGGNRHGFLAFSEIHPDYYQIPVADRQALIEAEAEEARAAREADDADEGDDLNEEEVDEAPKKKPRRRRSRKAKASDSEAAEATSSEENADPEKASESSPEPSGDTSSEAPADDSATVDAKIEAETEEKPKPKRRSTRRKPAPKKAAVEEQVDSEPEAKSDSNDDTDDDGSPQTMAAIVEMDEISEPLPEDDDKGSDGGDTGSDDEPVAEEKPKRRTSRPRRKTKAEKDAEAAAEASAKSDDAMIASDTIEMTAADESEISAEATEDSASPKDNSDDEADTEASVAEKPKRQSRRRPSRKKEEPKEAPEETVSEPDDDSDASNDNDVELVGQEDAMEEVPAPRRQRRHYKIQEVIKRRQVLLVQVVKEERGTKGAALTTYLSLAGRYSVLMPNTARGGGISRKITNSSDRKRLKAIASELEVPAGMGVILRTAGAARTKDEINRDFEYLMRLWEQVRNLTLSSSAPCLVYEEGSLIKRSIRDLYDKDTGEVIVAGEQGFTEAKDFMTMLMPTHSNKVKHYSGSQAIFAKYGVEGHLDKMVSPEVTLKSGGYLVINQTEALVAVDVNSGRSTREHSVEDTALQTNLEAAEEVARQLRLRDLAGLIVIDFIDMEERRNNRSVEKRLKDCLKNDRARIQVGRISHFGLMEMSRQRMRASVLESTMDTCPHCAGTGYIRSDSAIALHVFRAIEEHVARHNRFDCVVKTSPSIAIHILNHKRAALMELEGKYGLQILIESDGDISGQEFKIEKGGAATGEAAPAPVGFQNDAALEAVDGATDEAEESGRRKRGRNRRRKGQDATESTDSSQANATDETVEADNTDNDDDQPRKKRRRGKRGGRKGKTASSDGEEAIADTADAAADASETTVGSETMTPTVEPENPEAAAAEDKAEAPADKPKSRSTRRRKAPVAPKAEPEAIVSAETSNEASTEDASKVAETTKPPRRRTTRRAPAPKAEETKPETSQETVTETAPQHATPADQAEDNHQSNEGEKKKSGWWNRGGGFF